MYVVWQHRALHAKLCAIFIPFIWCLHWMLCSILLLYPLSEDIVRSLFTAGRVRESIVWQWLHCTCIAFYFVSHTLSKLSYVSFTTNCETGTERIWTLEVDSISSHGLNRFGGQWNTRDSRVCEFTQFKCTRQSILSIRAFDLLVLIVHITLVHIRLCSSILMFFLHFSFVAASASNFRI